MIRHGQTVSSTCCTSRWRARVPFDHRSPRELPCHLSRLACLECVRVLRPPHLACLSFQEIRRARFGGGARVGESIRVPGTEMTNLRERRRPATGDIGQGAPGLAPEVITPCRDGDAPSSQLGYYCCSFDNKEVLSLWRKHEHRSPLVLGEKLPCCLFWFRGMCMYSSHGPGLAVHKCHKML